MGVTRFGTFSDGANVGGGAFDAPLLTVFERLDRSEKYRKGAGVTFLCSNKKVTKEIAIGEVADREAYRGCVCSPPLLPRLRAALPYVPLLAPIEALIVIAGKKETFTPKTFPRSNRYRF